MLPLMGWAFWVVVQGEMEGFLRLPQQSAASGARFVGEVPTDLLIKAAVVLVWLGLFDLYRQHRKMLKRIMMTKYEVKREQKAGRKSADQNPPAALAA